MNWKRVLLAAAVALVVLGVTTGVHAAKKSKKSQIAADSTITHKVWCSCLQLRGLRFVWASTHMIFAKALSALALTDVTKLCFSCVFITQVYFDIEIDGQAAGPLGTIAMSLALARVPRSFRCLVIDVLKTRRS